MVEFANNITYPLSLTENKTLPISVPKLESRSKDARVPWIIKDGTISTVLWPKKITYPVQVQVPLIDKESGQLIYVTQKWFEENITYDAVRLRGKLHHYENEIWSTRIITYVPFYMKKEFTNGSAIDNVTFNKVAIGNLERICLALLGGSHEESNQIQFIYTEDGRKLAMIRNESKLEIKGLGSIFPKLNFQIANSSTIKTP